MGKEKYSVTSPSRLLIQGIKISTTLSLKHTLWLSLSLESLTDPESTQESELIMHSPVINRHHTLSSLFSLVWCKYLSRSEMLLSPACGS